MQDNTVFRPGFWLMRRMRFSLKLAILAAVVLLPLLVVLFQLVSKQREDIESTRVEVTGIELIDQAQKLIAAIQSRQASAPLLSAMDASLQAAHNDIAGKDWSALRSRLAATLDDSKAAAAAEGPERQLLVADMRRFVYGLGKDSGLLFDPDPVTYLIMDMVVSRTLLWSERVQGLRALLQDGDKADAAASRQATLGAAVAALDNGNRDTAYAMEQIRDFGVKDAAGDAALAASDALLKALTARLSAAGEGQGAEAVLATDARVMEAIQSYQSAGVKQVHELLQARLEDGKQKLWLTAMGSACGVLLMLYFVVCFHFSFMADLGQVMAFMEQTAQGNLRHEVAIEGNDELSHMTTAMHSMVSNLSSMVASVRSNAALVSHAGSSLVDGNHALSDRTEQQAANLQQTAASVQELSGTVQSTAQAASSADASARTVRDQAESGLQSMSTAIQAVVTIQSSTKRMDEVVGVIDGLAFQTNILALNAAVEAARAGESGRGFAVVASEVRNLAQRSSASAKEIRQLIATSSKQVDDGVLEIRSVGQRIEKIVEGIRDLTLRFSEISTSSNEQSVALTEITSAVRQLDEITQKNASMVEYAVDQSSDLQSRAQHLGRAVAAFHLQQGTAEEAQALVQAALHYRQQSSSAEDFVRSITSPQNQFFDRDMYVFVLDANGTYLGFGGNPSKVGTRVQNIPGIDGAGLMQKIAHQANKGPGWVEYEITNPASGRVQEKMSYVARVDAHYVGCGVYKNFEDA